MTHLSEPASGEPAEPALDDAKISELWMEAHNPHRTSSGTGDTRVKRFARLVAAHAAKPAAPTPAPVDVEALRLMRHTLHRIGKWMRRTAGPWQWTAHEVRSEASEWADEVREMLALSARSEAAPVPQGADARDETKGAKL